MFALREPKSPERTAATREASRAASRADARTSDGDAQLVCRARGLFVAHARDRIEVNGAHAHSFINPEGSIYRVGCFAAAPGALPWGEPSGYFTWFAGFEWRIVGCGGCGAHLGWIYTAGQLSFVALILDRLVLRPAAG